MAEYDPLGNLIINHIGPGSGGNASVGYSGGSSSAPPYNGAPKTLVSPTGSPSGDESYYRPATVEKVTTDDVYGISDVYSNLDSKIAEALGISSAQARELAELSHTWDLQAQQFNSDEAAKQRFWSEDQAALTREFNSAEAQKQRDFESKMSNTAHQREIEDLIAAGLNPVLSAKYSGASTPSGVSASASNPTGSSATGSNTSSGVLGTIFSQLLGSITSIVNNQNTINGELTRQALANSATMRGQDLGYKSSIYGSNMSYASAENVARIQGENAIKVEEKKQDVQDYLKSKYPDSPYDIVMPLIDAVVQGLDPNIVGVTTEERVINFIIEKLRPIVHNDDKSDSGLGSVYTDPTIQGYYDSLDGYSKSRIKKWLNEI